jgi:hypothetical protein
MSVPWRGMKVKALAQEYFFVTGRVLERASFGFQELSEFLCGHYPIVNFGVDRSQQI